ncbi:MAG: tyrosine--tRNA ligase [Candidatus Woesebacteria bacterium]|jgi:tyrosyl-tRNA synthetase
MKISNEEILNRGVSEILPNKNSLVKLMNERKIRLYLGIDPTGAFLHLGHAVALRKLQQFAELGHQVILLIGNGTVKIGDPTGRDSSRPMLTDKQIEENFKNWKKQASKILDFDKIEIRHNGDWLDKLSLPEVIKLMAKSTVQQLIERDMFQERIKKGLPIHGHEILYPLLQGYDSVAMDVDLEIGGTDQTFNMMMGRTLQKIYNNKEKWVLTTPIINGTDGRKMSKSFSNYVSLTENPENMYGKLMSMSDEMITEYFKVLTDVPLSEIEEMEKAIQAGENPMTFKKKLAFSITQDLHSEEDAKKAQEHFEKTVQNREIEVTASSNPIEEKQAKIISLIEECPSKRSKSDLRRLVEQGGITIFFKDGSSKKVSDANELLQVDQIDKIKVGKREVYQIKNK